jgi:hypothetical protein
MAWEKSLGWPICSTKGTAHRSYLFTLSTYFGVARMRTPFCESMGFLVVHGRRMHVFLFFGLRYRLLPTLAFWRLDTDSHGTATDR